MNVAVSVPSPPAPPPAGEGSVESRLRDFHDKAIATDEVGIQLRILNASKGPAVRDTRAQVDRSLYKQAIRSRLENQPNLTLLKSRDPEQMDRIARAPCAGLSRERRVPGATQGTAGAPALASAAAAARRADAAALVDPTSGRRR